MTTEFNWTWKTYRVEYRVKNSDECFTKLGPALVATSARTLKLPQQSVGEAGASGATEHTIYG